MEESLPWLDPKNKDDQLLATVIEVMRMRPRSRVWLITGDINLQNKAEFANVPFMEPPDPV
jgi:predicted ribonuclease YlaK